MTTTLAGFTLAKPSSAPTCNPGTASGALDTSAVYQYKITYVTAFGETDGSATGSTSTTLTGSINLTAIPVSPDGNVTQRKIYRTVGGGSSFLLLATIDDNLTTTYADIIADGSLGAAIPTLNSASSRQVVGGTLKMSKPMISSIETGITAFATGGQTGAYQLTAEVNVISVVGSAADSVKLPELSTDLIGTHVLIANNGANSANVFPTLGQDASAGVNTAVAVAAAARAEFIAVSATAWIKSR